MTYRDITMMIFGISIGLFIGVWVGLVSPLICLIGAAVLGIITVYRVSNIVHDQRHPR